MPDYSKGKVYSLTCDDPNLVYYGSTVLELKQRESIHKDDYKNYKENGTKYCSSSKLYKVGGVKINLVLECPCNSLKELRQIEQTYINNNDCINEQNAYLDKEEYEKSDKRINDKKIANEKYFKSDKCKKTRKNYNQTEERKEANREYKRLQYQDYLFTKSIFEEE